MCSERQLPCKSQRSKRQVPPLVQRWKSEAPKATPLSLQMPSEAGLGGQLRQRCERAWRSLRCCAGVRVVSRILDTVWNCDHWRQNDVGLHWNKWLGQIWKLFLFSGNGYQSISSSQASVYCGTFPGLQNLPGHTILCLFCFCFASPLASLPLPLLYPHWHVSLLV